MPSNADTPVAAIRLDLLPSRLQEGVGIAALGAAAATLAGSGMPLLVTGFCLAVLALVGTHALGALMFGRGRALASLAWQEGDRWLLRRADGRCAEARLHPRSRRAGLALLLVFRRGVFSRLDRPWILVLPHMVSDPAAARRLRMRFTLDGAGMRGLRKP